MDAQLISLSPKLSNSTPPDHYGEAHGNARINLDSLRVFLDLSSRPQHNLQVKFAIESESDLTEVTELERELAIPKDKILLMPQACERENLATKSRWLAELCRRTGYNFSPRLHIERFGNKWGT